jgi:beta-1,4-N-acetylglucosaminyltransferase
MTKELQKVYENIFVTVGTTDFDELISVIDTLEFLDLLKTLKCQRLTIQIGRGKIEPVLLITEAPKHDIMFDYFRFKPSLDEEMKIADLVISHCGAGSILEALSLDKTLIVVVNESLQENHQIELAEQLSQEHYCVSVLPKELLSTLSNFSNESVSIQMFPKPDYNIFPNFVKSVFHFNT